MKQLIYKIVFAALIGISLAACSEPDYFTATITPTINSLSLENGDELIVSKVEVSNATIKHGDDGTPEAVTNYTIDHMEFFLGNVKIGETKTKPYAFTYKIDNLPTGKHEFRVDALITHLPKRVWRDKDDANYPIGNPKGKRRARISGTFDLQITDPTN